MLAGCGATIIDADAISRSLTEAGGAALMPIKQVFGEEVIGADGALNRGAMREIVFAQPASRTKLEAIIHPLVQMRMSAAIQNAPTDVVVLDIPLLVESPRWRKQIDLIVVVDCNVETQVSRVMQRNGWAASTIESIIQSQATRGDRLKAADVVIFNEKSNLSILKNQVNSLGNQLGL
jgi:dephospho-CoA kinase